MKPIVTITLENEMDLVLIQKRCGKLGELLFLTLSSKATFITAVSEVSREVIEETNRGLLEFSLENKNHKYALVATITYPKEIKSIDSREGVNYARKLITQVETSQGEKHNAIELKLSLPRSSKLDEDRVRFINLYFVNEDPVNAYDEVKRKNFLQEEQLKEWRFLNEKKTEFLTIASHELKTPLTTIKAYTQLALALDENKCGEEVRKYLKKVEMQTNKLYNLIQQLLDISKIEGGRMTLKRERVELKEFIEDIVSVHRQVLTTHQIETKISENCHLLVDRLRIEQVISNIIMNAAKYSDSKSSIFLRAHFNEKEVCIEIQDEGIGMSELAQKNAFNKFYREDGVSEHYAGLGMGLYIASRIIEEHNGRIWITSEQGRGSIFYFTLPLESAAAKNEVA